MTDSTKEERGSAVTIEIRLLGTFEVRRDGRGRPGQRLEPAPRRRAGQAAGAEPGATAAPRAGHRRAVARPGRRRGRTPAAQGRPFRPQSRRRRHHRPAGRVGRPVSRPVRRGRRGPVRGRRGGRPAGRRRGAAPSRVRPLRRRPAARGPLRGVGGRSSTAGPPAAHRRCCGDLAAGTTWCSSTGPTKRPIWSSCGP